MVIKRLGAQRFSGLEADVSSLPIDADLLGAIFNSTDTLKFFIFNGTVWNESSGGGGGITGLEPNSTILEYLNSVPDVFTDYTTPDSATATSQAGVSLSELKAYYKFDEASGNIINQALAVGSVDAISTAEQIPTGGSPNYSQAGQIGDSVNWVNPTRFDATNTIVTDWNFMHQNGTTMSMALWVKLTSLASQNSLFATNIVSGGSAGMLVVVETSGVVTFNLGEQGADRFSVASTPTIPADGNFHFLSLTYDDATGDATIRIDGNARQVFGGNDLTNSLNAAAVLGLGSNTSTPLFTGNMDELSIWNRTLSVAEEDALYNGGSGLALDGAETVGNAIDGNTTTFWQSDAGINEAITLDMGSNVNMYGLAYFLSTDAGMTETQFQIKIPAITPIQATGGTITQDGDFKIHTFLEANQPENFVVTSVGSAGTGDEVEFLVVAGGAGGGGVPSIELDNPSPPFPPFPPVF